MVQWPPASVEIRKEAGNPDITHSAPQSRKSLACAGLYICPARARLFLLCGAERVMSGFPACLRISTEGVGVPHC